MKGLLAWIAAVVLALCMAVGISILAQYINCDARDGFIVWGNTWRFGFDHREPQCIVGRFE